MTIFSRIIRSVMILGCLLLLLGFDSDGAVVRDIRWNSKGNFTRCVVELSQPVPVKEWDYSRSGLVYVDLYLIDQPIESRKITIDSDLLKSLHIIKYPKENVLRLVYNLKAEAQYTVSQLSGPPRLVFDLYPRNSTPAREPSAKTSLADIPAYTRSNSTRKLIVIDPGHGGKDPGAVADVKIGGREIQEKDLTLQVARMLQQLIAQSPNLDCRLTRETDSYVGLDERINFAEAQQADLFISIHYNAAPNAQSAARTRGLEIYYLNPDGSSRQAARLLEQFENAESSTRRNRTNRSAREDARLKKLVTDKLNQQIQLSYRFCQMLQDEFERVSYFKRSYRGIKDANFRVLNRQIRRPTVLIEVGYLSNRSEALELATARNQRACAQSIYNAVNRYFAEADPQFVAMKQ